MFSALDDTVEICEAMIILSRDRNFDQSHSKPLKVVQNTKLKGDRVQSPSKFGAKCDHSLVIGKMIGLQQVASSSLHFQLDGCLDVLIS